MLMSSRGCLQWSWLNYGRRVERLKRERDRKVEEELAREEERAPDNAGEANDDGERTVKVKFWKGIDRSALTAGRFP
jgi:hypothetical protein